MRANPELSIVVPLYNEEDNVQPLVERVQRALAHLPSWELILVNDGSRDRTAERAEGLAGSDERVRVLSLTRNSGQTAAFQAGLDHARAGVVVTMDGDLQNDPEDIPLLLARLEAGYDLVAGYRVNRQDKPLRRRLPSWLANRLIRWITGVPIRDNGCSLKAYRREVFRGMKLYADMHRFIPVLAVGLMGARVAEVPVRHHPRRYGESKYGLLRTPQVLADLLTLKMLHSFRDRPLLPFGIAALGLVLFGVVFGYAMVEIDAVLPPFTPDAIVLPAAVLAWVGVACYLVMLGMIAEVVVQWQRRHGAVRPLPMVREIRW